VARELLPMVEDNGWFFDTELLVRAEHRGLRIHEVPVDWTDDPDSRVDLVATAVADLRGLWRISRQTLAGRAGPAPLPNPERSEDIDSVMHTAVGRNSREETTSRFVAIGGLSTMAYLALLVVLTSAVGILAANAIALTLCAAGNAAAHRSLLTPLSPPGPARSPARHPGEAVTAMRRWAALRRGEISQVGRAALIAWAAGLMLSSLALLAAHTVTSSLFVAVIAVLAANAVISVGRFIALRAVMYNHHLDRLDRSRGFTVSVPQ
jgi:putative flippase GtrA